MSTVKDLSEEFARLWQEASDLHERDEQAGFQAFLALSDRGYARSAHSVAWCYRYGRGTKQDLEKAKEYYQLAIAGGYDRSHASLFSILEDENRLSEAHAMAKEGAKNGSAECYLTLALECMLGRVFAGNARVCAFLASRAYELNRDCGQILGYLYLNGSYFPKVYPYAKYCIENSTQPKKELEKCGQEFPDFWEEIEAIPPVYPDFGLTLESCEGLEDPVSQFEEAQRLFYCENGDEKKGTELLRASVEGGYAEAMYRMFLRDMPDYEKWLTLGADGYGEPRCIETLAALYTDVATFKIGNPYLNKAVHYWNLRKKLHGFVPVDELVLEQYNAFNEKFAKMLKSPDPAAAASAPCENAVLLRADGSYERILVDFSSLEGLYAPLGCDRISILSTQRLRDLSDKLGFALVMYCDEKGMMKRLGENKLAAELSGYEVIPGDVVICGFNQDYAPLSQGEVEELCLFLDEQERL